MSTLTTLRFSDYAKIIGGKQGFLIYHSLFSNPVIIGPDIYNILTCVMDCKENISVPCDSRIDQLINSLKDQHFLVETGVDERELLQQKIIKHCEILASGSQLRHLDLSVSEVCNFGCKHCIHNISVGDTRGPKKLMEWAMAKKVIDRYMFNIEKHNLSESEIHFGTVEPLINWSLIQQSVNYCESFYPSIKHHFHIETNLSLLDMPIAKFLKEHNVKIAVSIDGYKAANDMIRITSSGTGTFDCIAEKCQLLSSIEYPLSGFTLTMTDKNIHSVGTDILDWACEMGMTEIDMDIDLLSSTGLSVEECVNKIMFLHYECLSRGLKTTGTWKMPYMNLINKLPLSDSVPPSLCSSAGGQNIAISPEGKIYICGHSSVEIGDISDFDNFFNKNGRFLSLISSRLSGQNKMCIGCEIESQCAGQCQVTREVSERTGDNKKVDFMCEFYRTITRKLLIDKINKEYSCETDNFGIFFPEKE